MLVASECYVIIYYTFIFVMKVVVAGMWVLTFILQLYVKFF